MRQAKVWNDNKYPHIEKYKGKIIEIQPSKYVEMDRDEALQFQGQFKAPKKLGNGVDDPRHFKMIRVEAPPAEAEYNPLTNPVTGKICSSPEELKAELAQYSHLAIRGEDEAVKLRQEMADLRQQIAEIKGTKSATASPKG